MSMKWCIGLFMVVLSVVVIQQQETVVHNQEIALRFTDDVVSTQEAQESIELLTLRLKSSGAIDVKAIKLENGDYNITYYSDLNVADLKELLDEEKTPFNGGDEVYEIEVYDLRQATTGYADPGKALFFEIKQDLNRGSQVHDFSLFKDSIDITKTPQVTTVREHTQVLGLVAASRSSIIPDVRAGPIYS